MDRQKKNLQKIIETKKNNKNRNPDWLPPGKNYNYKKSPQAYKTREHFKKTIDPSFFQVNKISCF